MKDGTRQKLPVKGVYVLRYAKSRTHTGSPAKLYDIAFLTLDDHYIEYSFMLCAKELNLQLAEKLGTVFSCYAYRPDTKFVISDGIRETEPIYVFVRILAQQAGFMIHQTPFIKMMKRISSANNSYLNKRNNRLASGFKYGNKEITTSHLRALWKKLVDVGRCPWINGKYDEQLETLSCQIRHRKRMLRIGMFYIAMVVRTRETELKSKLRRRLKENPVIEQPRTITEPAVCESGIFSPED